MIWIRRIALANFFLLIGVAWGFAIVRYEVFPYQQLKELQEFGAGHRLGQKTNILEKLENDLGGSPKRFISDYPAVAAENTKPVELPGRKDRRGRPLLFVDPTHQQGYRAIFGAMDFEETFWGGALLSPGGKVLHTWNLSTDHLPMSVAPAVGKNMYGVHLAPDGSVIFLHHEEGGGIVKVDACGKQLWALHGRYHHTASPDGNGFFWSYQGGQGIADHILARISETTGEIDTLIDMRDVRQKNPFVNIFNLQSRAHAHDLSHGNDIEPLPAELADDFEGFEAGDLLLSYRTQNLVFVIDPDTYRVKWWRIGAWGKQHDADWEPGGVISVFSNNGDLKGDQAVSFRELTDIITIDPVTFEAQVAFNGEERDMFSRINGDHQLTPYGTRMITSSTQGWVLETDQDGKTVFSFVNAYDADEMKALSISKAYRFDEDYFDDEFWKKCTADR